MLWFQRLFPVLMILFPLIFTLLTGRHSERAHEDARQRMRAVWGATLAALALHVGMEVWIESNPDGPTLQRFAWTTGFSIAAFFTLWFGLATPALQARHPGWRAMPHPGSTEPVRSASLTRRDTCNPVSRGAWALGWTLFVLCVVVVAWSISNGAPGMLVLGLGWWLGMSVFGSRGSLIEAEPMDAAGSAELAEAWAGLRRFKAWGFFALGLLGTIGFAVVSVLAVLAPRMAGMSGAVIGIGAGIAGGIFGTMGSVRRARVNALFQELSARESI